jgi:hypothetical protein
MEEDPGLILLDQKIRRMNSKKTKLSRANFLTDRRFLQMEGT